MTCASKLDFSKWY